VRACLGLHRRIEQHPLSSVSAVLLCLVVACWLYSELMGGNAVGEGQVGRIRVNYAQAEGSFSSPGGGGKIDHL